MSRPFRLLVGIDWATQAHQVCIINQEREVVRELSVEATGAGLAKFADLLLDLSDGDISQTAIAIEVPRGPVVELLVERGFAVFAINPKQLDRFRDRHTVAGAKDDRRDALVLADSLRTDQHCFRRVKLDASWVIQLRELSRMDHELSVEITRLTNRLRDVLQRYYPQALSLSSDLATPWLWELLHRAPTPQQGRRLRSSTITRLLRTHRIRRLVASDVLVRLRIEPLVVAPGTVEAASNRVLLLLPRLQLLHSQRKDCAQRIDRLLELPEPSSDENRGEHRDVEILRSLPGIGRLVSAAMLSEAHEALNNGDYHTLRAQSGVAPVTRRSGKSSSVSMRYACNERLRYAMFHWARSSVLRDPHCKSYYASLRGRGHSHGRALRAVGDRSLRVLMAMLKHRTLYDPSKLRRVPRGASLSP